MTMVTIDDLGAVRVLTLNRPEQRNAITRDGWEELRNAFEAYEASDQRCLLITGAGGDFCSGAELTLEQFGELQHRGDGEAAMRAPGAAALALSHLFKPTVAVVDGVAVGAGMNLALGCDIVIASERARFAEIFVKRGLSVDWGGTWLLPRAVGRAVANDLAMTGRVVGAEEALALGMVSRVVPADQIASQGMALAEEIAAGPPQALRSIKRLMRNADGLSFKDAVARENEAQAVHLISADAREGVRAFLEKRPPNFTGE